MEEIDWELDRITEFSFISVSVKNVLQFLLSSRTEGTTKTKKSKEVDDGSSSSSLRNELNDSFNLQILLSLQSKKDRIYKFSGSQTPLCKQVVIEGFNPKTFEHWNHNDNNGFIGEDIVKCFDLLKTFDLDLESKDFIGYDIENSSNMAPVTFHKD